MFERQATRLGARLRAADPLLSRPQRDDISNELQLLLNKLSVVNLSEVHSSPMPFLELVLSAREDLKQFEDLNQRVLISSRSTLSQSDQYREDREDIEQDLRQIKQIFEDFTNSSPHRSQQVRSLLQDSRKDFLLLVSFVATSSLLTRSVV
jgi:hypothetical protein